MSAATTPIPFSDYIVFVDESGDHGMGANPDPDYPIFVLAFCVFSKDDYLMQVCPAVQKLKFKHWATMRWSCTNTTFVNPPEITTSCKPGNAGISSCRAYEILEAKFRRSPHGDVRGWGLKTFP